MKLKPFSEYLSERSKIIKESKEKSRRINENMDPGLELDNIQAADLDPEWVEMFDNVIKGPWANYSSDESYAYSFPDLSYEGSTPIIVTQEHLNQGQLNGIKRIFNKMIDMASGPPNIENHGIVDPYN